MKKLYKSNTDKKVAGVCGGIAKYLGMDATVIRIITLLAILFAGSGLVAYIICALLIPDEPYNYNAPPNSNDTPHSN